MAVKRYSYGADAMENVKRAVALGVFDGLHIGHRAVLSAACGHLEPERLTPMGLSIVGVPKACAARLLTAAQEERLLETLGIEEWLEVPFAEICDWSPERFVNEFLHERLQARVVVCGYNFRFGKGGAGDVALLRTLCDKHGIPVIEIDAVERDGASISSTRVRAAVECGDMAQTMRLLGRPFAVELPVSNGDKRGRRWGMPTLNQVFPDGHAVPRFGVYASLLTVDGKQYRAVTNVGVHPTVGGVDKPQAETWIQDFEGELYGQTVCVLLIRFLREERQFDTVEALREQIAADAKAATDALSGADGAKAILFDFDDTLQDRTKAFLDAAHRLLRRHMPSASAAQREEHADTMWRLNNGGYVNYDTYFDTVVELLPLESGVTAQQFLWEFRRVFPGSSVLFPETPEVLCELERQGYRIGVLTNGNSFQQNRKLDVAGVRLFADLAVVAGDEPIQKPNPQLFRWLAERLCVAPENCVFVGDHPINDIQGALDAGMKAVFLNSRQLDEHPDGVPEVKRLQEILNRI